MTILELLRRVNNGTQPEYIMVDDCPYKWNEDDGTYESPLAGVEVGYTDLLTDFQGCNLVGFTEYTYLETTSEVYTNYLRDKMVQSLELAKAWNKLAEKRERGKKNG